MIHYKSAEEIELIRISSQLVSKTLAEVAAHIRPGVTTAHLDKIAFEFISDQDAVPAFKGYHGFPGSICTSLNEAVVHGIPGEDQVLKDGDVVSVDCGVIKNEFVGDSAFTFVVGEVDPRVMALLKTTRESLELGVQKATIGARMGDIGQAVQAHAEGQGYSVVRELVGHGIGRSLHEEPEVPNYGHRGKGIKLQEGLTIAIEPMINLGKKNVVQANDGWTIITSDKEVSAHYEHTIAVTASGPLKLSTFEPIDEAVKNNMEMQEIG
jgi:methionyl aminopeptidase